MDKKIKKILVVEDDESLRETFSDVLQQAGYLVETAENGQVALNKIHSGPLPDLILLDLIMPIMGGRAFLEAMANAPVVIAPIPVMIVSGNHSQQRPGDKAFVKKPCDLELLLKIVSECLNP